MIAGLMGLLLALGCGCDEKPSLPPSDASREANTAPLLPPRPTTQQILDSPRKTLVLGSYPLVIDVPGLWDIKVATDPASKEQGSSSLSLEGPAPAGDVLIQVSHYPVLQPADALAQKETAAAKEKKEHPDTVLVDEMRSLGTAKVLERRVIENGDLNWSLRVFTPNPTKPGQPQVYDTYMLNFILLPVEQYQKDKGFLEQITQTLRYNPLAGELGP